MVCCYWSRYLIVSIIHWFVISVAPECAEIYTTSHSTCDEPSFLSRPDAVSKLLTDSNLQTCEQAFVDSTKTYFRAKVANAVTVTGLVPRIMTVHIVGYGLRCAPVLGINVIILPSCQLAGNFKTPITCTSKSETLLPRGMVRCTSLCDVRQVEWNIALVDIQRHPGANINYNTWSICEITFGG